MSGQEQPLHVLVVGAGFCGLACAIACRQQGMDVTVLEQVPKMLPLGDMIGFGSNATKLFVRWGLFDRLNAIASKAGETVVHNWDSTILTHDTSQSEAESKFGYPVVIGHRGHLHSVFLDEAIRRGVNVRLGCKIVDYNADKPSVILASGEEVTGDVVVASEGVKSLGREKVLGNEDKPIHSGYAVYRAFMDSAPLRDDPLTKHFVESDQTQLWIGADMHGYVVSCENGTRIGATLTHKDIGDVEEGWSFPGKREEVLECIKGWDPVYVRIWEKIENIIDFKLVFRTCLDKWVHDSGRIIIAGDAAHPFLPTSTQGASQAIEDAATIALCLAKAGKTRAGVPLALHAAFRMRYEHVKAAQMMGISQREAWHNMHNKESGKMVEEVDESIGVLQSVALWSHDCEKVVHDQWDAVAGQLASELQVGSGRVNCAEVDSATSGLSAVKVGVETH